MDEPQENIDMEGCQEISQAGMIGFITLQQSAPSQMTYSPNITPSEWSQGQAAQGNPARRQNVG
jgi:hypothetical protein